MATLKNLTIVAALLIAGTAMAQNSGQPPVSGGAGNPAAAPGPSAKSAHKHKQTKQAPAASDTKQ